MEQISHDDQHRLYPPSTVAVALNGERLGIIRAVYPHYFLVHQDDDPEIDLEVPAHAIKNYDGEQLYLSVNRRELSAVDADGS